MTTKIFCLIYIGYGTSSSLEVDHERFGENFQAIKGRKKKSEISRNEIKRHIKNGNQRYRKRQERYYIDALKKIYVENGYITTTTPKRSITDVSIEWFNLNFVLTDSFAAV